MSLRNAFKGAVDAAFAAAGDIPVTATYRIKTSTYDPATMSNNETIATHEVQVIVQSYTTREQANQAIQPGDMKIMMKATEITFTPNANDEIIVEGNTYDIVDISHGAVTFIY